MVKYCIYFIPENGTTLRTTRKWKFFLHIYLKGNKNIRTKLALKIYTFSGNAHSKSPAMLMMMAMIQNYLIYWEYDFYRNSLSIGRNGSTPRELEHKEIFGTAWHMKWILYAKLPAQMIFWPKFVTSAEFFCTENPRNIHRIEMKWRIQKRSKSFYSRLASGEISFFLGLCPMLKYKW